MTTAAIKSKLHQYIDTVAEKKLKAIYTMVESEIENETILTAEQKKELDKRWLEYKSGKSKPEKWSKVKSELLDKIKAV